MRSSITGLIEISLLAAVFVSTDLSPPDVTKTNYLSSSPYSQLFAGEDLVISTPVYMLYNARSDYKQGRSLVHSMLDYQLRGAE